jgi:hypothetical protein
MIKKNIVTNLLYAIMKLLQLYYYKIIAFMYQNKNKN